jgi:carbon dioxide concentrating mechanism protein CcmM
MAVQAPAASPKATAVDSRNRSSVLVHPLAQVVGDVHVEGNVAVAPGVAIRAEQGSPCWLGENTVVQEGAAIYALGQGRVLGDDQVPYAVWIGRHAILTHKVLVQGPAYVGSGCFVGFRSTVLNSRLGENCVVMMHALIQDVVIPPGKLVPSGSVVTRQDQADALPNVTAGDRALVQELLGQQHTPVAQGQPQRDFSVTQSNERDGLGPMERQKLSPEVVQRVRQYLAQGLRIGTEHADSRRYRSGVWQTCSPVQSNNESEVFKALETCLAEHAGEYVRMFGIDPKVKQRVAPVTIQRPDGKAVALGGSSTASSTSSTNGSYYRPAPSVSTSGSSSLPTEVVQQIRQYLNQGYVIGTEHADVRRYRSNVWQTCSPIESPRESEVVSALEACLSEHAGEYVRMFGIDPKAKCRIAPVTIQRPDGKPVQVTTKVTAPTSSSGEPGSGNTRGRSGGNHASGDVAQQVRQWLSQGFKIGVEHADARRYRSNVWQTCAPAKSSREGEVIAAIEGCMAQHAGEYVRIFGIDPKVKRRVGTVTVQRPGDAPTSGGTSQSASYTSAPSPSHNGRGSQGIPQDVAQQVSQLVNQGYRVSWEHADSRRYRSGAWKTGGALEGSRVSDIVAALEAQLSNHSGEYVRLVGIDPKAKRRVLETTIQRP